MVVAEKPEPPVYLTDESKRLWRDIVDQADIDAAAYPILVVLCEAADRRHQARLKIEEMGAVIIDRFGQPKRNPWVDIEDRNAQTMTRAYTALGFNQAPQDSQGKLDF